MGWFSSPSKIDPFQIRDLMESDYTTKLDNLATEITDQSSGYNQDLLQNAMKISEDQTYTQNRINRMNTAMTGGNQSGIMNQVNNQNVATSQGNVVEDWFKQMMNNKQTQIGILQGNQQIDSQIGEAQASAYGQNITNKNNYNSAMAGNVMGIASSFLCDAKMKENIKKVGGWLPGGYDRDASNLTEEEFQEYDQ
jgi:hypothetical protein